MIRKTKLEKRTIKKSLISGIFEDANVIGLAGERSSGKTNNLIALIVDFREIDKERPIYLYGFSQICLEYLKKYPNIYSITNLDQLADKTKSLIIIDEFQELKLHDSRYTSLLDSFIASISRNDNYLILSSPNLHNFNKIIGRFIEKWLLKTIRFSSLTNGSQLKNVVQNYKNTEFKRINDLIVPKNRLIIDNRNHEQTLTLAYISPVDSKRENAKLR